jgi:hypothetical protein
MSRFLGIDFSGGARPWRRNVAHPTVWVADAEDAGGRLRLLDLRAVQSLEGDDEPFGRLTRLLAAGEFQAAAIDAPFCLPLRHMPERGHVELLRLVSELPLGAERPFPSGAAIVSLGEVRAPKLQLKPYRETEDYWRSRGVTTRSTMWNGPRPGAPFTAACLRLLQQSGRPCWPWAIIQSGLLVEAFPAAQLRQWGLEHQNYWKTDAIDVRKSIVSGLEQRVSICTLRPTDQPASCSPCKNAATRTRCR